MEAKRRATSLRAALRRLMAPYSLVFARSPGLWNLLLSYIVISVVYSLGIQLYGPFLRSMVECDTPPTPGAPFSGSAYCGDAELVLAVAQAREGSLVSMKLVVHAVAGPCLGAMADRIGRRPVLLASLGGYALAFVLLLAVSARRAWHSYWLVSGVFFIEGATNAFDVVYMSMIADMTTSADRATAFAAYLACSAGGQVAAQLLAVAVLRMCLESYAAVWLALSAVLVADVLFARCSVAETLAASGSGGPRGAARGGWGWRTAPAVLLGPLRLALSAPFLRAWLLSVLLASLAAGLSSIQASFSIAVYGWRPGDLQAYTWFSQLLRVGSLSCVSPYANRIGSPAAIVLVQVLLTSVASLAQVFSPFSPVALLGPAYMLDALAFASSANAAFLSAQFGAEHQAKVHAVQHLSSNLGTSLSIALFSSPLLFRPELRGRAATRPFLLAFTLGLAGGAVKARLAAVHLSRPSSLEPRELQGAAAEAMESSEEV